MDSEEVKSKIKTLEDRKKRLIEQIKKLNDRKRYKEYEQRALVPFVEKTKEVRVAPLRKKMKYLEFKIATQAFTPQKERLMLKELNKLEQEYSEVREIERARRKVKLVEKDIEDANTGIDSIEKELKDIREELKELYKKQKITRVAHSKGVIIGKTDEMFSLEDMAEIEE
ncbi:hypothetical protein JXB01_04660 [Candidatus Micrarchaeota archaeon]|nr:hypothetical protein [Candidatus Micrarchaeota archaeon]